MPARTVAMSCNKFNLKLVRAAVQNSSLDGRLVRIVEAKSDRLGHGSITKNTGLWRTAYMKCGKCEKEIQSDWATCPWCSAAIPQRRACHKCGEEIDATWKSCPFCGEACANKQEQNVSVQDSVIKGDIHLTDAREQSTHNTTIMNNSTTNVGQQFVGSTVNFNQTPTRKDQALAALEVGKNALLKGAASVSTLRDACKLAPNCPDTNLAFGIAILSSERIGKLSHDKVQEAELALGIALGHPGTRSAAAQALGALRHCFYLDHSMRQPSPSFDELKAASREDGKPTDEQKAMLARMQHCKEYEIDWIL